MADERKKFDAESLAKTKLIDIDVNNEVKKSFIAYAMAVNVSRAIPDVRDGLKPVHRRILYAMNELGLDNSKPYRKCARIVGDVLGKYHPHGDYAVYEALVRLAQDFSIRAPLVDGQGNFGSVDGDPAAAQRYTEAKLSKIAAEMLRDIDKKTVDFYPNFDETLEQPSVLPARFPNLLVNGSDGIAVGMATSIPPHNLSEVCNATIALLDNPELTSDDLMQYVPAPDFPTAGVILGRSGIRNAYRTGRGSVVLRARTEIEEFNNGTRQRIVITELPYQVNKSKLIKDIADMVKEKRVEGISDIREESDRHGMRVVIDVKRDANAQVVLNTLYKHSDLQKSIGIIFLALVKGTPKVLSLREMLVEYVEHQKEVITRRTRYDLEKAEERDHILRGLITALENIDEVIRIIRGAKDNDEAQAELMNNYALSEKQANAILEMRLRRLTSLEVEKLRAETEEVEKSIADFRDILANPERVVTIIKDELGAVSAKYGDERRSTISYDYSDIDIADLIEQEDIVVSLTHTGYVKRMAVSEYRSQHRGGTGITAHKTKEEDFVEQIFTTNTHEDLLFFTNFGKVYCIKGFEIPEGERTARGRAIVNILPLSEGEKVNAMLPRPEGATGNLMLATKLGYIKKTDLKEFESIYKVGKKAIVLEEGDELISAQLTTGEDEILVAASSGRCVRFDEKDVRAMGRASRGVISMKLGEGDVVVDMTVCTEGADVLTVTSNGYGKRSNIEEYTKHARGTKGMRAGVFTEKTGKLVNLKLVKEDEDIMLIADNGVIIRMEASSISKIGRSTQGVKLMRLKGEGSQVVCVAITPHEEQEENQDVESVESTENVESVQNAENVTVEENAQEDKE